MRKPTNKMADTVAGFLLCAESVTSVAHVPAGRKNATKNFHGVALPRYPPLPIDGASWRAYGRQRLTNLLKSKWRSEFRLRVMVVKSWSLVYLRTEKVDVQTTNFLAGFNAISRRPFCPLKVVKAVVLFFILTPTQYIYVKQGPQVAQGRHLRIPVLRRISFYVFLLVFFFY